MSVDKRMYNREEKRENYSAESKYVADILSNMASATSTVISSCTIPATAYVSAITSTPSLTPTSLANLEQTFIELQSVPVNTSVQDPHTQSGFVPPIIDPVVHDRSNDRYEYAEAGDPDWIPGAKRARTDRPNGADSLYLDQEPVTVKRKSGKARSDDKYLSIEEAERRKVRRERNKVAAAKCRQRRVDHTNRLVEETEQLEEEKGNLEVEIQSLQQQKDQLEFILQAHRPLCKAAHVQNGELNVVKVKSEPSEASSNCSASVVISNTQRPSTLALIKRERKESDISVSTATGIPITTPSSGFFTFGLDSMVDHTGLTPITNGPSSCSSEVNRTSESSSENATSPTLISL